MKSVVGQGGSESKNIPDRWSKCEGPKEAALGHFRDSGEARVTGMVFTRGSPGAAAGTEVGMVFRV